VGELERPVALDNKAQLVVVASDTLKSGDLVTTAGWGLYGPTGHLSNVLRRSDLVVSVGGENEIVKTEIGETKSGIPIDTCAGDSGGPLLKWSDDLYAFTLHATLKGGGYDCIFDSTNGDGIWNSVFPHLEWIESFLKGVAPTLEEVEVAILGPAPIGPVPSGRIHLKDTYTAIGDQVHEGSVFLDGKPVCDNSWDIKEAQVVCRYFGYSTAAAIPRSQSHFGVVEEGSEFAISDLSCNGDESHLLDCLHTSFRSCGVNEVAGVTCLKQPDTANSVSRTQAPSKVGPNSVDGWASWSDWSVCTRSCGGGTFTRVRSCSAESGGEPCQGSSVENKDCNTQKCPVDGSWADWSSWSGCSRSCGRGIATRARSCSPPEFGGKPCSGEGVESQDCEIRKCPVDGSWSPWSAWSSCSSSCGGGSATRVRSCSPPLAGGRPCEGEGLDNKECGTRKCPVDGSWSTWSAWSSCSSSCGPGQTTRVRSCSPPEAGGAPCSGKDTDSQACEIGKCVAATTATTTSTTTTKTAETTKATATSIKAAEAKVPEVPDSLQDSFTFGDCDYKCTDNGGCISKYTGPSRPGNSKGTCFPESYGGRCIGTPRECDECNAVLRNCENRPQQTRPTNPKADASLVRETIEEGNVAEDLQDGNCEYECKENGACNSNYVGPPRAGPRRGTCFPASFGDKCSGIPKECKECNKVKSCPEPSK